MDNPFFVALAGKEFSASELESQTNNMLIPFVHYLDNSIKALEKKEVRCEWKPLANHRYRLTPNKQIYQITPISEIEIVSDMDGWFEILRETDGSLLDQYFEPDPDDRVSAGKGPGRQTFELKKGDYESDGGRHRLYLPGLTGHDVIQWSGYQLKIRPLSPPLDDLTEVHIDSQACQVKSIKGNRIRFLGKANGQSKLSINGQNTNFRLLSSLAEEQLTSYSAQSNDNGWLIFSSEKPELAPHRVEDRTAAFLQVLSPESLTLDGTQFAQEHWELRFEKDRLVLEARGTDSEIRSDKSGVACLRYPALRFTVHKDNIDEKWIQLIEKDSGEDTGKSVLDYFFEDNITIHDNTQKKRDDGFTVLKSRREERQILLARKTRGKKSWQSEYPSVKDKTREIRVTVDTTQLKKQKNALYHLMNRPATGHIPLILLLQDRLKQRWQKVVPEPIKDWQVLTDPAFDGCERQREFVTKALATPDFAILDGPPGTGKTTTILELIIQLVLRGKRILLSASTHAAINNVLERIQESHRLRKHIFPLRIGDESNAVGVEAFQFDKLYQQLCADSACVDFSKQLMVDASNLVCGTTIGILRLFNDSLITLDHGEPPFDVMIIDECSKTTFQEFLVPARFARRWVLVGDIRQLSPFTDREQIVANLDNLMLEPPKGKKPATTLDTAIQEACLLLEELRGRSRNLYEQPMMVPVSASVLNALKQEIAERITNDHLNKGLEKILLIQKQGTQKHPPKYLIDITTLQQEPWHLYDHTLCCVEETCLSNIQPMIPDDMLVLSPHWPHTGHAFCHFAAGQDSARSFKIKKKDCTGSAEVHQELFDHLRQAKWSEEICWRLEREYWLRQSANPKKKTGYLAEALKRLFPKSVYADGRIHILKNIAFPSILEALSGGGLVKRRNDQPTTLNQGFNYDEKAQRLSTLSYQHRMHPDISAFPRKQFYPEGILLDGRQTRRNRNWNYHRYEHRNTWLDVRGHVHGNANKDEVITITKELKAFCGWAENTRNNKKNEPFDVAILTFYKGQEKALREALQKELPGNTSRYSRFSYKGISIKLATVDYFQGQEADLVFLSMVNTFRDGFMDSPNRLNVAVTRARYQLVIVGHYEYFKEQSRTDELRQLAGSCSVISKKHRHNKKND